MKWVCSGSSVWGRSWQQVPFITAETMPSFKFQISEIEAEEETVVRRLLAAEFPVWKESHAPEARIIKKVSEAALLEIHNKFNTPYKHQSFVNDMTKLVTTQFITLLKTEVSSEQDAPKDTKETKRRGVRERE